MRRLRRARARAAGDERGAVVVEFALIAPLLLMLVFGIIDFGWMMNRDTLVNNASRDGVRVAALGGTYSQICTAVKSELSSAGISTPNQCNDASASPTVITIDCIEADGTACNAGTSQSAYDASVDSGVTAVVTVKYIYSWITPMTAGLLGRTKTITETTQMVVE